MKIINNTKLIKRNKKLSQIVLYTSMALLSLGFIWSITNPGSSQATFAYIILIPAYILVQVSIFMANRWGRSPSPDEIVSNALKGLNNQYALYNYSTSVPHLLVGPAGIMIIKPYHHTGEISYNPDKKKFEQKGGPNFLSKIFAQEKLPNLISESKLLISDFHNFLKINHIEDVYTPTIVNLFYSEKAILKTKNAPETTLEVDKLKDYVRQTAKNVNMSDGEIGKLIERFPSSAN